ncbi:unnamed protein product, partial [Ectocarpus fasciculatus]
IKTGLIRAVVLPCSNNEVSQHPGYSHSAGRNYIQPRLEIRTRHGSCVYSKQPETVRNITSHQQAQRNRGHVYGRQHTIKTQQQPTTDEGHTRNQAACSRGTGPCGATATSG